MWNVKRLYVVKGRPHGLEDAQKRDSIEISELAIQQGAEAKTISSRKCGAKAFLELLATSQEGDVVVFTGHGTLQKGNTGAISELAHPVEMLKGKELSDAVTTGYLDVRNSYGGLAGEDIVNANKAGSGTLILDCCFGVFVAASQFTGDDRLRNTIANMLLANPNSSTNVKFEMNHLWTLATGDKTVREANELYQSYAMNALEHVSLERLGQVYPARVVPLSIGVLHVDFGTKVILKRMVKPIFTLPGRCSFGGDGYGRQDRNLSPQPQRSTLPLSLRSTAYSASEAGKLGRPRASDDDEPNIEYSDL